MISRKKLHDERSQTTLIAMIYAEIYSRVVQTYGSKAAAEKLKQFGNNVSRSYYNYWRPSSSTLPGIIREISREIGGIKKLTLKRTEDGFTLSSKECPLCVEGMEIEGIHYCFPTMGILEEMLNLILRDKPKKFRYKGVVGEVTASQSCGAEECAYKYRLIEREEGD